MSTTISLVDSMLLPRRVTAFRESRPDCPDGVTICLGGLRFETTTGEWRLISAAIEAALTNLAPRPPCPSPDGSSAHGEGHSMSAMEELVREAMGSGVVCFTDKVREGAVDMSAPVTDAFGDFPAKFLEIRSDLVDAVTVEILEVLSGDA